MTADILTFAVQVFCALTFLWALTVLAVEVRACHRRGLARVHAGRSWDCRPGCARCWEQT